MNNGIKCRVSELPLVEVLNFGRQPLGNGFLRKEEFDDEYFFNMKVGFCEKSFMLQLIEQPNPSKTKIFFSDLGVKKLEIFFDRNLNFVKEFKLRGVPTTILINKKGEEFARIIGEIDFQDKKFLKWLLKYD